MKATIFFLTTILLLTAETACMNKSLSRSGELRQAAAELKRSGSQSPSAGDTTMLVNALEEKVTIEAISVHPRCYEVKTQLDDEIAANETKTFYATNWYKTVSVLVKLTQSQKEHSFEMGMDGRKYIISKNRDDNIAIVIATTQQ